MQSTNKPDPDQELIFLTSKLLDLEISREEHFRLSDLLLNSRENRLAYLEMTRLESLLHWEPGFADLTDMEEPQPSSLVAFPIFAMMGSIAAALIALFGAWWAFTPGSRTERVGETAPSFAVLHAPETFDDASFQSPVLDALGREPPNEANREYLVPSPRSIALSHATRGMEVLRGGDRFSEGGVFEFHGALKRWNRLPHLASSSENGILPASGSSMIGFDKMSIDVESQIALVEETVQVLDVREALQNSQGEQARLFAAVKFNQSFGDSQNGAEFGLTLQAFREGGDLREKPLARVEKNIPVDLDPSTWDEISSELEIPADAEFVVVSLSAKKSGPDALLANTSSYYSDDLELTFSLGNQFVVGPI